MLLIPHCLLSKAPDIKLTNVGESITDGHTRIECTTSCDHLIAWRQHTLTRTENSHWYDTIGKKKSGNQCTETIALTSVWPSSVETVSVQCVAISLCNSDIQTCVQSACLSDIQSECKFSLI